MEYVLFPLFVVPGEDCVLQRAMKLPSTATPEMCGMQSVQKLGYHFLPKQGVKCRVKTQ
jgi:hypothetical protein